MNTEGIKQIGQLSLDAVFIYDFDTFQFKYINKNFATIFNVSEKEVVAKPALILPFIRSEDIVYLKHLYSDLIKTKTIHNAEFRINFPNDVLKHLVCDAFMIDDKVAAGFLKDITKEKEHEDYLTDYGAKKDTLLDMMTHNLSGPLHLTQNIITWMHDSYHDQVPEAITTQLNLVKANTQECIQIVNDFLIEEHTESERIYVKKTRFNLLERIVATLDKLVATNKSKKFKLITDLQNLNINTDSVKFFQAIHNLISNSIKFTPEGGEITIIVEEHPTTFIVRVKDDGIGIPQHLKKELFMKRTTSQRTGLGKEKSSGLGLHIVQTLVHLMDGTVNFESEENKGATFSIELPKD